MMNRDAYIAIIMITLAALTCGVATLLKPAKVSIAQRGMQHMSMVSCTVETRVD